MQWMCKTLVRYECFGVRVYRQLRKRCRCLGARVRGLQCDQREEHEARLASLVGAAAAAAGARSVMPRGVVERVGLDEVREVVRERHMREERRTRHAHPVRAHLHAAVE